MSEQPDLTPADGEAGQSAAAGRLSRANRALWIGGAVVLVVAFVVAVVVSVSGDDDSELGSDDPGNGAYDDDPYDVPDNGPYTEPDIGSDTEFGNGSDTEPDTGTDNEPGTGTGNDFGDPTNVANAVVNALNAQDEAAIRPLMCVPRVPNVLVNIQAKSYEVRHHAWVEGLAAVTDYTATVQVIINASDGQRDTNLDFELYLAKRDNDWCADQFSGPASYTRL